ncbi:MAG: N-acetyltransferase family protein [Clostridia bacterium]|nr:N-acetyltransferase family protein [Clostridia bacterium]
MKIEYVTVDDVSELLNIYAPYVQNTAITFEYEVPTVEEFANRIANTKRKFPYIKAIVDGEIVGYAYAGTFRVRPAFNWSVETSIYVKSDCRRSGVGRALYEALEGELKKMGIINVYACIIHELEPNPYVNDDSYNFHLNMGYRLIGRFPDCGYKFDRWFDMIWMEKHIGDHVTNPDEVKFGIEG